MTLQFGDVVLIRMQFHQTTGAKVRPALVLLDAGDEDFVAAPITSHPGRSEYDVDLNDWRIAGLNVESFARVHKLTVLAKTEIVRRLHVISDKDIAAVVHVLCRAFCRE
jgi:mRNA interferase MazF